MISPCKMYLMLQIILWFSVSLQLVGYASGVSNEEPTYFRVFSSHSHWDGSYIYNGTSYYCYLFVHSEHYAKENGLLATFKDQEGATIEIEGESPGSNDLEVTFKVHVMFEHVGRFWENFTFTGVLSQEAGLWKYAGRVIIPDNGLFGAINLQPTDNKLGPYVHEDESLAWRYAIIIGIPIIMAVIGVAGTVAIVYWAIKKGYIRHVPKSYDNFDNPVQYNTNKESVHI